MNEIAKCELCGEPMPQGEEMFKFHGYSGPCPKPPMVKQNWMTKREIQQEEIESLRQQLALSNKCLKRVREACLFSEDDGSIGVTQEPHIPTQLFDDVCKALKAAEPKEQGK